MKKTQIAGGIVLNSKNQILIVSQRGLSWSFPKGKIQKDESELEAAKREVYEESGVKSLDFIKKLGVYKRHSMNKKNEDNKLKLKTRVIFLFKTKQEKLSPKDPENTEVLWVDKEKVADLLTHKKDKEFFLRVKDKI